MTRPRDDYGDLVDLSEFDADVQLDHLRHQQMRSFRRPVTMGGLVVDEFGYDRDGHYFPEHDGMDWGQR